MSKQRTAWFLRPRWILFLSVVMVFVPLGLWRAACWLSAGATPPNLEAVTAMCLGAGVGAAVALFGVLYGLRQYWENSRNLLKERAARFWTRADEKEFTDLLDAYEGWKNAIQNGRSIAEEAARLPKTNSALTTQIEYMLDFYEEICAAIHVDLVDEQSIYVYMGDMIVRHVNELILFRINWHRKHPGRKQQWQFLESRVRAWNTTRTKAQRLRRRIQQVKAAQPGPGALVLPFPTPPDPPEDEPSDEGSPPERRRA